MFWCQITSRELSRQSFQCTCAKPPLYQTLSKHENSPVSRVAGLYGCNSWSRYPDDYQRRHGVYCTTRSWRVSEASNKCFSWECVHVKNFLLKLCQPHQYWWTYFSYLAIYLLNRYNYDGEAHGYPRYTCTERCIRNKILYRGSTGLWSITGSGQNVELNKGTIISNSKSSDTPVGLTFRWESMTVTRTEFL